MTDNTNAIMIQAASELFKILQSFNQNITMFDETGNKTSDPEEARYYYLDGLGMVITIQQDTTLKHILRVNVGRDIAPRDIRDLLGRIRGVANKYMLGYVVKTFGKRIEPKDFSRMIKQKVDETINVNVDWDGSRRAKRAPANENINEGTWALPDSPQKVKALSDAFDHPITVRIFKDTLTDLIGDDSLLDTIEDAVRPSDSDFETYDIRPLLSDWITKIMVPSSDRWVNPPTDEVKRMFGKYFAIPKSSWPDRINEGFSGWHGSARKSMNELDNAKIVVKHRRSVDEMKRGARTRQIESIFIENSQGERFRFPSNNVTAAKAMVRHVNEGGTPFDDFGQYIYEAMEELNQLKVFARQDRKNNFFESEAVQQEVTGRIQGLRSTLGQISGPKGYKTHFESYQRKPLDESQLDEISSISASFGPTLESAIPYIARVVSEMKVREQRETQIKEFAKAVMNSQVATTEQIDQAHPEQPGLARYETKLAESQAWAAWLSERVEDDTLSESLRIIAEHATTLSSDYQRIIEHAIRAVLETATMASPAAENTIDPRSDAIDAISTVIEGYNWQSALGIK